MSAGSLLLQALALSPIWAVCLYLAGRSVCRALLARWRRYWATPMATPAARRRRRPAPRQAS